MTQSSPTRELWRWGGESAIKNSGTFENYGTVDLSGVTNFSKYSGTITGSGSNDKIVIPANSDPSSYTGADSFTLSNASIITYNSGGVDLKKTGSGGADGKLTLISNVYTSVNTDGDNESVVAKTRFTITESTPELVNTTNYTWADLIKAGADYESDTLDIDQYGLGGMNNKFSLKSITLEYDTTIPFGLTSSNSKFKASNDQALTISGNCSGLDGGISTDGNLTFSKAAPKKGTIDCNGVLTLGESGTIDGEVQAGSLNIPYGVSVIFSNEVTTSGNNSGA